MRIWSNTSAQVYDPSPLMWPSVKAIPLPLGWTLRPFIVFFGKDASPTIDALTRRCGDPPDLQLCVLSRWLTTSKQQKPPFGCPGGRVEDFFRLRG